MVEPDMGHNTSEEGIAGSPAGRVAVGDGLRRINRQSRQARWMGWSVSGSLALHVVMFYVMILPVQQITAVSLAPNPDFFWLSPFFIPGDRGAEQPLPEPVPAVRLPVANKLVRSPEEMDEPVQDDNSSEPAEAEIVMVRHPVTIAKKELPAVKLPPVAVKSAAPAQTKPPSIQPKVEAAPVPSRSEVAETPAVLPMAKQEARALLAPEAVRQDESAAAAKQQEEQARLEQLAKEQAEQARREQELQQKLSLEAEKAALTRAAREKSELEARQQEQIRQIALQAEQAEKERVARRRVEELAQKQEQQRQQAAEQARLTQEKAEHERKAAEAARQEMLAREQAERERMAAVQRERLKATADGAGRGVAKAVDKTIVAPQLKPANAQGSKQTASKAEKPKGLAIPTVPGDLKLVVSGTPPRSVRMAFREFGLERRNRPFSRAESRSEVRVTPVVIDTQENVREYVVARTGDGVYSMTLELDNHGGNGRFAVMLYDGSARKQKKVLDTGSVRNGRIQVRVLMPDGIFWDDENAFTGTMEDSDSVTKFNAETGLVWKEFNND